VESETQRGSVVPRFVLASSSVSRLRTLLTAGFDPDIVVSGVSEEVDAMETEAMVMVLAERKASAAASSSPDALVLGCDSLLDIDGVALGKPESAADVVRMWTRMAGQVATLSSGHCLIDTRNGRRVIRVASTQIFFGNPSPAELRAYIATGEPMRNAGGFSIEGFGAPFVQRIEGDPNAVLGLSLTLLRSMLSDLGIAITDLWRRQGPA
jgi:septum formation protein